MSELTGKDVAFVGLGTSAVMYYRCLLPAQALGADWCGLSGEPPKCSWHTGLARGESRMPQLTEYKVVVLQQPRGLGWLNLIRELQGHGVKVLYEIDDYIHGIRRADDHGFKDQFTKKHLAQYELCMRACDGLIASTAYIARRYKAYNKRTFVCQNGLDIARYDLTLPERELTVIGWAGATGHQNAVLPWLQSVTRVMMAREKTGFVSIGQPFANPFRKHFGNRAIATPFAAIEQYPGAMTMMDIALAPAGRGGFYKGKSDLRWLEAGALGVPIIADPEVYPEIEHGVTGFHALDAAEAENLMLQLVDDEELRTNVGRSVRAYIREHRDIKVLAENWMSAFAEVLADD